MRSLLKCVPGSKGRPTLFIEVPVLVTLPEGGILGQVVWVNGKGCYTFTGEWSLIAPCDEWLDDDRVNALNSVSRLLGNLHEANLNALKG